MVELNRVQSLVASPGKKRAAFTFYKYTIDGDQEASNIRFFDIDEPENVRNATDFDIDSSDDEPVWLDESNIAFTAKRNNASETNIYVVNVDTGNQYQLTNFSTSVSGLIYSPTANVIAFTAPVFQGLGLEETAKTLESISSAPAHGKIYDTLYVRHWDTWLDGTKSQLFALPLTKRAGQYGVSGDPQNLVSSYPGSWGLEPYDYSFSKDGQTIVFAASIPGRDEAWSTRANIFTVPVHDDSQTQPFSLNSESIGGCSSPTFSPNGTYIAWLQMSRPNNGNDQNRIMLYSTVAAETKCLVPQWSLSPDNIQFSESGQHLLIVVEEEGDTRLYRLDVDSGNLEQLTTDGTVQMPIEIAGGSMMFMYNTAQSSNEIMRMTINDSGVSTELISTFNTDTLSHVWMSPPTRFYFTGALGDRVQGVLYRPYGFNMSRTYPLAFIIHGGPYGSSGNHWSWRWNQDIFANQGFVVVEINFHGSTGFGQAFADAVRFQWGGHPFEDLMKGLNYVTRTYSFIDTNRMAALGASYGGYMITWMLGQTTPFKAYVCHDGEFSSYSTFFSTDEIGFDEHESGLPWDVDGMATYERWDPRRYVGRWNTPTLVIH
ncbi:dipeptidylpeptidase, partial [Linderina macrospora]